MAAHQVPGSSFTLEAGFMWRDIIAMLDELELCLVVSGDPMWNSYAGLGCSAWQGIFRG